MIKIIIGLLAKVLINIEKLKWYIIKQDYINNFKNIGKKVYLGRYSYFTPKNISIGDDVHIGQYNRFISTKAEIIIGNKVLFGPNVSIHGGDHRYDLIGKYMIDVTQKEKLPKNDQDVIIGNDVWIGSNVVILKGSIISDGAIIGAGCIVNGQVDPYTIVVGNKDRKILKRFKDSELKEHLHLLS